MPKRKRRSVTRWGNGWSEGAPKGMDQYQDSKLLKQVGRVKGSLRIAIRTETREYSKQKRDSESRSQRGRAYYRVLHLKEQNLVIRQRAVYVKVTPEVLRSESAMKRIVEREVKRRQKAFQKSRGKATKFAATFQVISGAVYDKHVGKLTIDSRASKAVRLYSYTRERKDRRRKKEPVEAKNARIEMLNRAAELLKDGLTNVRPHKEADTPREAKREAEE